jgi:hypothetical protein
MFNGKLRMLVKNPHYKKIIPLIISHDFGSFIISFFSDKKKNKNKAHTKLSSVEVYNLNSYTIQNKDLKKLFH